MTVEEQNVTSHQMAANPSMASLNQFGYELFQKLSTGKENSSAFSPYSVYAVFLMVAAIATGDARTEVLQTLHIDSTKPSDLIVQDLCSLTSLIECEHEGTVNGVNSIWTERDLLDKLPPNAFDALKPLKAALNMTSYPQPGVDKINNFVKEKTHGLISNLLSPDVCPKGTFYVLVNCLYFIDHWKDEFPKSNTYNTPFHAWTGDVDCAMMFKQGKCPYFQNNDFQFIKKPYKTTGCSMLVALPKDANNHSFMATLTPDYLDSIYSRFETFREIRLRMPKFTTRTKWNQLKDALTQCGMVKVWKDPCLPGEVFAADAIQEAVVIVDEEKTEAAAATAAVLTFSAMKSSPITFTADHPFGFFIINDQTQAILFMGVVTDPTKEA